MYFFPLDKLFVFKQKVATCPKAVSLGGQGVSMGKSRDVHLLTSIGVLKEDEESFLL